MKRPEPPAPRITLFDALGPPVLAAIAQVLLGYALASGRHHAALLCLLVAAPLSIRNARGPYLAYVMTRAYRNRHR